MVPETLPLFDLSSFCAKAVSPSLRRRTTAPAATALQTRTRHIFTPPISGTMAGERESSAAGSRGIDRNDAHRHYSRGRSAAALCSAGHFLSALFRRHSPVISIGFPAFSNWSVFELL